MKAQNVKLWKRYIHDDGDESVGMGVSLVAVW